MNQNQFHIPKQNDRFLVKAMVAIRDQCADFGKFVIRVAPHFGGQHIDIPESDDPENSPLISFVLSENSEVMPHLWLVDSRPHRQVALGITRQPKQVTDVVTIQTEWADQFPPNQRSQAFVKLMALSRKHLRASEVEASLTDHADSEWSRYRDAQQAVLNSLQETQKSLLVEVARRSLEAEIKAKEKYDNLETELRANCKNLEEKLAGEHTARLNVLNEREGAIEKREKSFNTKEARYVARHEQQKQIDQIKAWLENWSLTRGTRTKRWPIFTAYWVAIVATGSLTIWFSKNIAEILTNQNLTQVTWWQWVLLSLKSILPFAAFTTFLVYFIKWSSAWARQHAEEEFRNRARVMDIGRAGWLLEAVRDAQDNKTEIPPELLKELSRNLFAHSGSSDGSELHPQAFGDVLMQGLSSIRVKAPDGSEVEATRNKKDK